MRNLMVVSLLLFLSACVMPTDSPDVAVEVNVICTVDADLHDVCREVP